MYGRQGGDAMGDSTGTGKLAAVLGATDIFGGLDPRALAHLAEQCSVRSFEKGTVIVRQGEPGDTLFVLMEGLLKVVVASDKGEEVIPMTLSPPSTFGVVAVADGGPRSASVEAMRACKVIALERATLLELAKEHPSIIDGLLRYLGASVRRLTKQVYDLVSLDLHGRVAKLLVRFAREQGTGAEPATRLDLPMTQSEIADMVGGSRQSVNQILHSFERRGYLELQGRTVVLRRLDLLQRRAGAGE
jgi:CRP/FNR family cyclic AMP-dependent transcriptional regulator